MNVQGLTIQDITAMRYKDIEALTEKDLRQLTTRLLSATNKRLKRIAEAGLSSPVAESKLQHGSATKETTIKSGVEKGQKTTYNTFSIKGKTKEQVLETLKDARNFINLGGSTVKGTRETYKKYKEKTGIDLSGLSREQVQDFFNLFNRIKEERGSYGSSELMQRTHDMVISKAKKPFEEIERELLERIRKDYEMQAEERANASDGVTIKGSDFII